VVDTRSTHRVLTADREFLQRLVKTAPAERKATGSYVASISQTCPGVLNGLGPITVAAEKPAVRDVIAEALGNLEVTVLAQDRGALATFARRGTSLTWSSPTTNSDVRRYFTAEDALYAAQPSDLCADAAALVADSGQTEPPPTLQWLTNFERLTHDAKAAERVFGRDLDRLSSPEDVPVAVTTTVLAAKLQANEARLLQSNLSRLLTALGLPAPVHVQDAHVRGRIHRMTSGGISASRMTTRSPRIGTPSSSSRRR
jgi:hypothetical protein